MKLFQKKKNNKGFSLVELIVVVAIMAVLLGVLVPTLVRHIETSKQSKDLDGIAEVRNSMEIALANEKFSDLDVVITCSGGTVSVTRDATTIGSATLDKDYVNEVLDNLKNGAASFEFKCSSKKYKAADAVFTIKNEHVEAKLGEDDVK
ncbi:MAG: type II secretion system GspH family protein [Butyrivibrio sp.]|nr:type II secretion system GspH family protein [Butyrivibrio sp.]